MSDEQPPKKRRFWQLHLSTAILLILTSAGLASLNGYKRSQMTGFGGVIEYDEGSQPIAYGWPANFITQSYTEWTYASGEKAKGVGSRITHYFWNGALIDIAVLLGILAVCAIILECLIRLRLLKTFSKRILKRRYWQMHLSTAVLLMFEVGGFVYLNIVPVQESVWMLDLGDRHEYVAESAKSRTPTFGQEFEKTEYTNLRYGWPFTVIGKFTSPYDSEGSLPLFDPPSPDYKMAAKNVLVLALTSISLALFSEWLIRRREGRKP
jgi:hypothetical protein